MVKLICDRRMPCDAAAFSKAAGDDGSPAYPAFNALRDDIGDELGTGRDDRQVDPPGDFREAAVNCFPLK